jgi:GTP-binding protein HflX
MEKLQLNKINKAVAVSVQNPENEDYEIVSSLNELEMLSKSLNIVVLEKFIQKKSNIDPAYYIGKGKLDEIKSFVMNNKIDVVLFDNELSGIQERNIEKYLGCNVLGRTEIILNIFNKRAKTNEAKLQIQLASLEYMLPRLKNRWDHFSRVEGGIGMRGGEGEKQIELDRRMLKDQISVIKSRLKKVDRQMANRRKNRIDKNLVSLVGYTNAGKTTLFNLLSREKKQAKDMLFTTLDSTIRKVYIDNDLSILLSDTVGFINKLPHTLVSSFKSTLDEVNSSKLLIHVIDVSSPLIKQNIESVDNVLKEINADKIPVIRVFNKKDLLINGKSDVIINHYDGDVYISALKNDGIEILKKRIKNFFINN